MKILLISSPYDSGTYNKRLGRGPASLVPVIEDEIRLGSHHVRKVEIESDVDFPTEVTTSFELNRMVAAEVANGKAGAEFPIVISGNCNTAAVGMLSGLQHRGGVIWFDCHGDFNTPETTIGGFLDGMALAIVTGRCWTQLSKSVPGFKPIDESQVILAGARDLDPLETEQLSKSNIKLISTEELNNHADLGEKCFPMESIYLHIDLDVLDANEVSVNRFATTGGLTSDALVNAIKVIQSKYKIDGLSFTAYDPSLDPQQKVHGIVRSIVKVIFNSR